MTRTLLVDECVNRRIVLPAFVSLVDVAFVADLSGGASDDDVLGLARREGMLLLTEDSDFGRLVFGLGIAPPPGIILVNLAGLAGPDRLTRVRAVAAQALSLAEGALVAIDRDHVRRRPFPDAPPP